MENLYYVSTKVEEQLIQSVKDNVGRYQSDGFADLATEEGWSVPLSVQVDRAMLKRLDPAGTPEAEVKNSLVVWAALGKLTPALANEGRIWSRLTHVECFEYTRDRWMKGQKGKDPLKLARAHFFGDTMTRRRDDNGIGRLWWNAYIAKQAMPGNHGEALKALLKTADIRSNVVERTGTVRMVPLAAGILRAILALPKVVASEDGFRAFMKNTNKLGGGVLFHLMTPADVDLWLTRCIPKV